MFCSAGCSLFRAEDFPCSLDGLYGGQGISKQQFMIKKISNFFVSCIFFQILVVKTLDPERHSD